MGTITRIFLLQIVEKCVTFSQSSRTHLVRSPKILPLRNRTVAQYFANTGCTEIAKILPHTQNWRSNWFMSRKWAALGSGNALTSQSTSNGCTIQIERVRSICELYGMSSSEFCLIKIKWRVPISRYCPPS